MRASQETIRAVQSARAGDHGSLFRRTAVHAVGGLRGAGWVPEELWLVASVNGLGVVDARSGASLARERGPLPDGYPKRTPGIGPARGAHVVIAGLDGGALPLRTLDGWQIAFDERAGLWLTSPTGSIEALRVPLEVVRVLGFSGSGASFVVGDGASLVTFAR